MLAFFEVGIVEIFRWWCTLLFMRGVDVGRDMHSSNGSKLKHSGWENQGGGDSIKVEWGNQFHPARAPSDRG